MINFKSRTPQKPLGLGFTESQKSLRMSVLRTELTLNLAHREKWFWIVIEIIQISNAYNSIILFKSEYRISLNTSRYFFISRPWLLVKQNEIQKEYKLRWAEKNKLLNIKLKVTPQLWGTTQRLYLNFQPNRPAWDRAQRPQSLCSKPY